MLFAPADMSSDEQRTNARDTFAAMREVDTTPIGDVRGLMRPTGHRGSIPRGRR
jgi:hypothetical protein